MATSKETVSDPERRPLLQARHRQQSEPCLQTYSRLLEETESQQVTLERRLSLRRTSFGSISLLPTVKEADEDKSDLSHNSSTTCTVSSSIVFLKVGSWTCHMTPTTNQIARTATLIATVLFIALAFILLPMYTNQHSLSGSDAFVAMAISSLSPPVALGVQLLITKTVMMEPVPLIPKRKAWTILSGMLIGVAWVLIGLSSPTWRTDPVLLVPLAALLYPGYVVCKRILTESATPSNRLFSSLITITGIIICTIPPLAFKSRYIINYYIVSDNSTTIWLNKPDEDHENVVRLQYCISWGYTIMQAVGWIAASSGITIFVEKGYSSHKNELLSGLFWIHVVSCITVWGLWWLEYLPWIGTVTSQDDLTSLIREGAKCFIFMNPDCLNVAVLGVLFLTSYITGVTNLCVTYVMSDERTSFTPVLAVSLVGSVVFWHLFSPLPQGDLPKDGAHLRWAPSFGKSSVCVVVGSVLILAGLMAFKSHRGSNVTLTDTDLKDTTWQVFPDTPREVEHNDVAMTSPDRRTGVETHGKTPRLEKRSQERAAVFAF